MATARAYICTLCEADDISNEAVKWCLECEEWLCTDCNKHHGRSKLSKQHNTITVQDYNILPPAVLKISNKCAEHNEKFERFCSLHGAPCCIQCISDDHKECKVRPLGEVLENIKTSTAICNLEEDLITIKENFETITKHLADKVGQVEEQKAQCLKEVGQLRKQLNDHLDVIEKRLTDELLSEQAKLQTKMTTLNNKIKSKQEKIRNVLEELTKMKQSATDLQLFLVMQKIEKELSHETRFVEDLINGDFKEDKILNVKLSPVLESLTSEVMSFGKVIISTIPTLLKVKTARQDHAQFNVPMAIRIDQIQVQKMYSLQIPNGQTLGCAILPDGQSVFTDCKHHCLRICNSDGVYIKDVELSVEPSDVCLIKDNLVAVSFYHEKKIIYIELKDDKTIRTWLLEDKPSGVDSNRDQIIVSCLEENTIIMADLDGTITNRIKHELTHLVRVSVWQNKIFCTDWKANKVLCYDTKGKLIWTCQNETIRDPMGIAVDKRGCVYVAVEESNKLIVITPDGDSDKVLLDENDGLKLVNCVSIYNDRLLLCNRFSGLAMYSLTQ